jgi:hypothetical protein
LHGAEGPDALQIKIKASIVVPQEGCGPSQARNPIKTQRWIHTLSKKKKASIALHGAERPDALQIVIKAPIDVPDLEGYGLSRGTQ